MVWSLPTAGRNSPPRPDMTTPIYLLVRQQPLDGEEALAQRLVVVGPVHRAVAGAVLEMCVLEVMGRMFGVYAVYGSILKCESKPLVKSPTVALTTTHTYTHAHTHIIFLSYPDVHTYIHSLTHTCSHTQTNTYRQMEAHLFNVSWGMPCSRCPH